MACRAAVTTAHTAHRCASCSSSAAASGWFCVQSGAGARAASGVQLRAPNRLALERSTSHPPPSHPASTSPPTCSARREASPAASTATRPQHAPARIHAPQAGKHVQAGGPPAGSGEPPLTAACSRHTRLPALHQPGPARHPTHCACRPGWKASAGCSQSWQPRRRPPCFFPPAAARRPTHCTCSARWKASAGSSYSSQRVSAVAVKGARQRAPASSSLRSSAPTCGGGGGQQRSWAGRGRCTMQRHTARAASCPPLHRRPASSPPSGTLPAGSSGAVSPAHLLAQAVRYRQQRQLSKVLLGPHRVQQHALHAAGAGHLQAERVRDA